MLQEHCNIIKVGLIGKKNFLPEARQETLNVAFKGKSNSKWEISGSFESDLDGFRKFESLNELLYHSDAVIINDLFHAGFSELKHIIRHCKHVLILQPFPLSHDELFILNRHKEEAQVVVQMGFQHRFTDLFMAIREKKIIPRLIENSHFIRFKRKSTQLSLISDVLLEDIDLIMTKVNSDIKTIHATGVGVIYNDPDILNIRMEFQNACIANISGSKIAIKDIHKTRFYQNNSYYTLDHLHNRLKVFNSDEDDFWENVDESDALSGNIENYDKTDDSSILNREFESFINAINSKTTSKASLIDHLAIKFVAEKIYDQLEKNFVAKCS
ncbi:MAG: hypothetical protein H6605_08040 [Flavobacteriales bacterium]|nr:hypothetical protein [Flavobacteriales bacterium]